MNATYHTIPEVAEYYHVKESTVQRWVRKGRLRVVNLGGNRQGPYLVSEDDMRAFESRNAIGPENVALASAGGTTVLRYKGNEVRMVEQGDGPWWVLGDVCKVMDITNTRNVTARLDEDEKGVHLVDTPGGPQQMTIVNEPGLYSVILRSDKPEAKEFKRWVTHEVLPAIRRTGQYVSAQVARPPVPVNPDAGRPTAELALPPKTMAGAADKITRSGIALEVLGELYSWLDTPEYRKPLGESMKIISFDICSKACDIADTGDLKGGH